MAIRTVLFSCESPFLYLFIVKVDIQRSVQFSIKSNKNLLISEIQVHLTHVKVLHLRCFKSKYIFDQPVSDSRYFRQGSKMSSFLVYLFITRLKNADDHPGKVKTSRYEAHRYQMMPSFGWNQVDSRNKMGQVREFGF